jgi:putative endonuclease
MENGTNYLRNGKKMVKSKKNGSKYKKSKAGNTQPKKAYTYSLNLKGGKKYVGYTTNIKRRLGQHFSGNGSKVTQECRPISVNHVQRCTSVKNAKKAETIVYYNMKKYHGTNKVRGAGHTKRFSYG